MNRRRWPGLAAGVVGLAVFVSSLIVAAVDPESDVLVPGVGAAFYGAWGIAMWRGSDPNRLGPFVAVGSIAGLTMWQIFRHGFSSSVVAWLGLMAVSLIFAVVWWRRAQSIDVCD